MFDGLVQPEEESFEKILLELLSEENIRTKTEIPKPLTMTRFEMLGQYLETYKLTNSTKMIENFSLLFRVNMISNKRQSRTEIIQALSEGLHQEKSIGEKLVQKPE
jgi:hypothetical protein